MSDFANTVHRPAILGGLTDFKAISLNSSMVKHSLDACWSRKEPVPAAHRAFMEKSFIRSFLFVRSSSNMMSLESSPPMSIMLRTWGYRWVNPLDNATISFMNDAPIRREISFAPVPVTATESISNSFNRFSRADSVTSIGLPLWRT